MPICQQRLASKQHITVDNAPSASIASIKHTIRVHFDLFTFDKIKKWIYVSHVVRVNLTADVCFGVASTLVVAACSLDISNRYASVATGTIRIPQTSTPHAVGVCWVQLPFCQRTIAKQPKKWQKENCNLTWQSTSFSACGTERWAQKNLIMYCMRRDASSRRLILRGCR